MNKIPVTELFKEDYFNNIYINTVDIIKENMQMTLTLSGLDIIDYETEEKLKVLLEKKFKDFKIILFIQYDNQEINQKFIDSYIGNIKKMIKIKVPSSISWIDEISFILCNEILKVNLPNKMAFHSLERNNIIALLKNKIKYEIKLDLEIQASGENKCNASEFLNSIIDREKEISKNIVGAISPSENLKNNEKKYKKEAPIKANGGFVFGKPIKNQLLAIKDLSIQTGLATIRGEIFQLESREIKGGKVIVSFCISDGTDSIIVKTFLTKDKTDDFLDNVKNGDYFLLEGDVIYDNYAKSQAIMLKSLEKSTKEETVDTSSEKRVELHVHSQMSSMDGMTPIGKIIERASKWGHKAIAITDHGVVQAFPEAMYHGKKNNIKILYGVEGYLVNDKKPIISNLYEKYMEDSELIVFDIETTGLSPVNDEITEIGALKIKDGKIIEEFSQLINPQKKISQFITDLTGITNEMVEDKPLIGQVIEDFKDFIGNSILVAHNASFDVGFIREKMKKNNINLNNPILDTLELSRAVFPQMKSHKLNILAKFLGVNLENHHRALDDARATSEVLLKILDILKEKGIENIGEINRLIDNKDISKEEVFHIIILAKNKKGLKNLYKLISKSHLEYFHRRPRIPKSLLDEHRDGLILGSACEAGELYKAIIKGRSDKEVDDIVKYYDYLEIQPLENNMYLVNNGTLKNIEQLKEINRKICNLGEKHSKLVVATGDVHFLNPEDEIYRRILMAGQGFQDADNQPPLYFKTTDQMLKEFEYLGKDKSFEVVVANTNKVSDLIEEIDPIPKGTFPPKIEGSEEELKKITYEKAYSIYGNPLPKIVQDRLDRELTSIIKNGYAVLYIISQKLVWKSLEDGYLVGSRGSVGSSFVATMSGITEVNPLKPHYICSNCKYSEFFEDGSISSGSDLKDKNCPTCNSPLDKDGQDIPFEVFLGFEGDKEPDIDLNFAGEYQAKAHKYTEELFGEGYVYKAGTIGTIADKTAYGFVKKYFEQKELDVHPAEINRLLSGCTGIKRTSGQHPGGVMIVPQDKEIYDFTPIQYPADDKKSGIITTHFDYNAISGRILKLDILGHDVPTIIRMLEDITKTDPTKIPLDEKNTMEIFSSTKSLGLDPKDIECEVGTLGIPEFGTKFVRQMLVETKPSTFSDLVRISGLSHGTDVWINNAQDLVKSNRATLSEVISTREDIMLKLINAGLDNKQAFWIMEKVRKGKGLSEEDEESIKKLDLPDWYIDACQKIKYMFPKAHAVAYVMMSFRIAYYKVYYPEAFYATYFTTKAADFDAQLVLNGKEAVQDKINEIENIGNLMTAKEKNLLTVLEVVREMYARGLKFEKVDLYKSHSDKFLIGNNGIIPPLKGLEGIGENAARKIVEERKITDFISVEDLVNRGKVSKTVIEALTIHGCLKGLPESNQISLFNI